MRWRANKVQARLPRGQSPRRLLLQQSRRRQVQSQQPRPLLPSLPPLPSNGQKKLPRKALALVSQPRLQLPRRRLPRLQRRDPPDRDQPQPPHPQQLAVPLLLLGPGLLGQRLEQGPELLRALRAHPSAGSMFGKDVRACPCTITVPGRDAYSTMRRPPLLADPIAVVLAGE